MEIFKQKLLLVLFYALLGSTIVGQDYTVSTSVFDIEQNLSHRIVNTLFQDKDGFMWVGTPNGLNRFDGYNFDFWTSKQLKIGNGEIQSIGQDDEGLLWIKCYISGLSWSLTFFDPYTEEAFTVEEKFPDGIPIVLNKSQSGYWVTHFRNQLWKKDNEGRLLFGTVTPPIRLITYKSDEGFKTYPIDGIKQFVVQHIDQKGNIWGNEQGNIVKINPQGKVLEYYKNDKVNSVDWLYEANGAIHYLGYNYKDKINYDNQLFKLVEDQKIKSISIPESFVLDRAFLYRGEKDLLLSIEEDQAPATLQIFDLQSQKIHQDIQLDENIKILHSTPLIDPSKRIWMSSAFGLHLINLRTQKFTNYFSSSDKTIDVNNSARGIVEQSNKLLVNFEMGGLIQIDKKTKNWKILESTSDNLFVKGSAYWGRPIIKDRKNNYWIGYIHSLVKFTNEHAKIISSSNLEHAPFFNIWSLYEDQSGRIWGGRENKGLVYFDTNTNFIQIPVDESYDVLEHASVYHIGEDLEQRVWLCTSNGFYLFAPKEGKIIKQINIPPHLGDSINTNTIYHFLQDQDSIFWIASASGLIRWNESKNEFKKFDRSDGFSNEKIYAVYSDNHQQLWMSSDYGILQFNPSTNAITNHLTFEGIDNIEFNRISHFKATDGSIYFGGLNGVTGFHPDDFYKQQAPPLPNLVIKNFEQFVGKANALVKRRGEIRHSKEIIMKPSDSFFQLELALLTYENVDQIQYAVKIEDLDQEWRLLPQNVFQQGRLPYGEYLLKVKARAPTGNWSEKQLEIKIKMIKPVYLRLWFLILAASGLLGGIWFYYQFKTKQFRVQQEFLQKEINNATQQIRIDKQVIEKQATDLRQLDKVKSRFFANVSHELRTPLTLILGPLSSVLKSKDLSSKNRENLQKVQQSGKDLLKLVGAILDLSKMESGKLELKETPLNLFPIIRNIISTFEPHAQRNGISIYYEYSLPEDLQILVDAEKLETILKNFLSNAIKFTAEEGHINIKVKDLKHTISIAVTDTGRGIHSKDLPNIFERFYQSNQADAPIEGGTGIGLALCKELSQIMGANIQVSSVLNQGSTFSLDIPRKEVFGKKENRLKGLEHTNIANEQNSFAIVKDQLGTKQKNKLALSRSNTRYTILVVEDNPALRDYIQSILSLKFNVLSAEHGLNALDLLKENHLNQNPVHLIISDIMMPVLDGYQLLNTLKSKIHYAQIPVVMLTARAAKEDRLKALRIGVDDYLTKPFEEDELIVRIENLLLSAAGRLEEVENNKSESATDQLSTQDQTWLLTLEELILNHLDDSRFGIDFLAEKKNLSRRQLQRKIKKLVGLTPKAYISEIRLHQARIYLESGEIRSIKKLAQKIGFSSVDYFSQQFKKRYGKSPSKFLE